MAELVAWWRGSSAAAPSDARVALAVFLAALLAYFSNGSVFYINADTTANAYLSASVLDDGDLAFSPFEAPFMFVWSAKGPQGDVQVHVMQWNQVPPGSSQSFADHFRQGRLRFDRERYYLVPTLRERPQTGEPLFVSTFGPAAGLAALPVFALARLAGMQAWQDPAAAWWLAKLAAAMLTAASAALLYLVAVAFVARRRAFLLASAYALGTCVWAISSQSLWQQTPVLLFLALGMLCLLRIPAPWMRGAAAGLAFSAAAACRPTAALVALVAGIWLLLCERRAFGPFVLAALPLAAAILAYNAYYFGSPLQFGQLAAGAQVAAYKTGSTQLWQTPVWLGAAGLLVSPSRGLLVYSPFLAAAFLGAVLCWRDPRYRALRFLTLAVPALWAPAFLWFDWWGGWAYGYRPIVDSLPLLALLCLPALGWIMERPVWRVLFALALAWSVLVQALGAYAYSPWGWNARQLEGEARADIDQPAYRGRLWSFRDWQIGYLLANFSHARAERKLIISH